LQEALARAHGLEDGDMSEILPPAPITVSIIIGKRTVRRLYLHKTVRVRRRAVQTRRCMNGGCLDVKIGRPVWVTKGRGCTLRVGHILLDAMWLHLLWVLCWFGSGSTTFGIRGHRLVWSPLFTSSLTRTGTLIWSPSFGHCIILALVISSETIVAFGPS
jgi:hypothetical protein